MMKSPTSLIRFRNAVGVMLALSALFAVVISAVTVTQDRALGQNGEAEDVLVTISVDQTTADAGNTVAEGTGGNTVTFTVSVPTGSEPSEDLIIPLTVTSGTAMGQATKVTDFTLPDDGASPPVEVTSVTISANAASGTYEINIVDTPDPADDTSDAFDEPQESFMVSLGTLPSGYAEGDPSSLTINIDDGDNAVTDGDITITVPDGDDEDTDPDQATGARVRQTLTADTSAIDDPDHDDADTADVDEGETVGADFPEGFTYSWQRDDGDNNAETLNEVVGTAKTYTPIEDDVGEMLILEVTWSDKHGNGNDTPADLITPDALSETAYNEGRPFIIKADTNDSGQRDPGDVLTMDTSGMFNDVGGGQLISIDANGNVMLVDGNTFDDNDDPVPDPTPIPATDVMLTWHRGDGPIYCDVDGDGDLDEDAEGNPTEECTTGMYTLTDDDVAETITLVATYDVTTREDDALTLDVDESMTEMSIDSDPIGRVHSTNPVTGQPTISGTGQVGQILTADTSDIDDMDGIVNVDYKYQWMRDGTPIPGETSKTYELTGEDIGKKISVMVSFMDDLEDPGSATSAQTIAIGGSPGEISRIEPAIIGITVSAGDKVMLAVDVYGLQDAKDNGLGGTFNWTVDGDPTDDDTPNDRELEYTAPSSPGNYTIIASLPAVDCQPADEDDGDACSAEFKVQVRRPSVAPDDGIAPQNPPGEIPTILTDGDGNQYEVFTPEGGGTFTGEGYTLSAGAGAIPNGEYIGVRVSDEGSASNAGMTHQRYTLGGNMYSVSAVDANNADITSYALNSAATVCVPLPDELRSNISNLALVAINADGSLTILSASVRLGSNGTQVCGNLSGLPASVAVGSSGAPAPLPTAVPPTATPEAPDTGGTAPTSNVALWALLLGAAIVTFGTFIVIGRRREGARK